MVFPSRSEFDLSLEGERMSKEEEDEELEEKLRVFMTQELQEKRHLYDQLSSIDAKLAFLEMALMEAYGAPQVPPGSKLH
jgi:hypothetical protein